jgi:hypothetical protein
MLTVVLILSLCVNVLAIRSACRSKSDAAYWKDHYTDHSNIFIERKRIMQREIDSLSKQNHDLMERLAKVTDLLEANFSEELHKFDSECLIPELKHPERYYAGHTAGIFNGAKFIQRLLRSKIGENAHDPSPKDVEIVQLNRRIKSLACELSQAKILVGRLQQYEPGNTDAYINLVESKKLLAKEAPVSVFKPCTDCGGDGLTLGHDSVGNERTKGCETCCGTGEIDS